MYITTALPTSILSGLLYTAIISRLEFPDMALDTTDLSVVGHSINQSQLAANSIDD